MKSILTTLLLFGFIVNQPVFAQKYNTAQATLDFGTGFSDGAWAPSVLYHEDMPLGQLRWLRAGLGIRAWGYYGNDMNLVSQAGSSSANTLQYKKVSANGVSMVAGASVTVWRVDLGVNTDLLGFAWGSKRSAYYPGAAAAGSGSGHYDKNLATRPVNLNAVPLFLNNHNGQSEIYGRVWLSKGIALKVGYQFGQLAYITRNIEGEKTYLDGGERRFSTRYNMPYAAVSFRLFR
ncbi:MAG TPA: hypothetical protein VGN64_23020 [Dyadobacter sp.]|jgi:hypothetical protein|nr:hypothetical protein [Dyadobacter sp.]